MLYPGRIVASCPKFRRFVVLGCKIGETKRNGEQTKRVSTGETADVEGCVPSTAVRVNRVAERGRRRKACVRSYTTYVRRRPVEVSTTSNNANARWTLNESNNVSKRLRFEIGYDLARPDDLKARTSSAFQARSSLKGTTLGNGMRRDESGSGFQGRVLV